MLVGASFPTSTALTSLSSIVACIPLSNLYRYLQSVSCPRDPSEHCGFTNLQTTIYLT